jgi:hypothetical protein
MTTVSATAYGMPLQTLSPPPAGGKGDIYSNSAAISKNEAAAQNNAKFGGRRRTKGGAAAIVVPPVSVPYKDTGGGTSANITNATSVQANLSANKQYDMCVGSSNPSCGQAGGTSRVHWGCMSGGKRRKTNRRRKMNKRRKTRRRKTRRR